MMLAAAACRSSTPLGSPRVSTSEADLVVTGGQVLTMNPQAPVVEAVAVAGGVIVAVGTQAEIQGRVGSKTNILDLKGGTATAGLVDAHGHLVGLGQSLNVVDLRGLESVEAIVRKLQADAPATGWVMGRGWDQNLWSDRSMPDHRVLSQAFPDRPVSLGRVDGHAQWVNEALLRAAKIDRTTPDPEGGEILRAANGTPSGVFIDAAMTLVPEPPVDRERLREFIQAGQMHLVERGITGVHEMGIDGDADAMYRELDDNNELLVRVHAYASSAWFEAELANTRPQAVAPDDHYALAGVKIYTDGALGSRGAAMLQAYTDRPGHLGLMRYERDALQRMVERATAQGWQIAAHAIGDAANRMMLDAYASIAETRRLRPRIEHAQILHPDDIPRFAQLGVIASMQPTHATSDMSWAPERIGPERLAGAYAWQSLINSGAHVCFGSDFPVELADITHGLYAALTRQDAQGHPAGGWQPEECVTFEQALAGFTSEAAYAAGREAHLGKIAVGYRADLTCFQRSLAELSPIEQRHAEIRGTIVNGNVVHWV